MPESPPVFRVSSMSHQPWLAATSKHHHHSLESQTQVTSKDSDSFVSNSTRHSHCLSWRQSTGLVPHMAISSHWPRVTVIHNLEPFLMPHFLLLLVWQFHRYKSLKVIYLSQSTSFAVLLARAFCCNCTESANSSVSDKCTLLLNKYTVSDHCMATSLLKQHQITDVFDTETVYTGWPAPRQPEGVSLSITCAHTHGSTPSLARIPGCSQRHSTHP